MVPGILRGFPGYIEERFPGGILARVFLLQIPVLPVAHRIVNILTDNNQIGPMRVFLVPVYVVDVLILPEFAPEHRFGHKNMYQLVSLRTRSDLEVSSIAMDSDSSAKCWHSLTVRIEP